MMMNFLDLSNVSEEDRRLIDEILSDTSVVNFSEPLVQKNRQFQQQHQQQQQQQQHHRQQSQPLKLANQHQDSQHYHQQQFQNHATLASNNNSAPTRLNHVKNHNNLPPQTPAPVQPNLHHNHHHHHHHHQQVPPVVPTTVKQQADFSPNSNNDIGSSNINNINNDDGNGCFTSPNTTTSNTTTTTTITTDNDSGSTNTINTNIRVDNTNTNINNNSNGIKSQATYLSPQDNSNNSSSINRNNNQNQNQNNLQTTITTSGGLGQATSIVPPHTAATQMPPPMAGDINSVIGMDMTSTQPPGYPMPPQPPTHVTTYGPPPAHHVYGGPPIFPSYPHYLISYNMPSYMPYVLPNSVVPPRQQVPPQSNQPPSTNMASNNSQLRSHSHHSRANKPKDGHKLHQHQQHQNQHHQHHHQHHQMQHQQHSHHQTHNHHNHHHHQQQQLPHHHLHQNHQDYRNTPEALMEIPDATKSLQHVEYQLNQTVDSHEPELNVISGQESAQVKSVEPTEAIELQEPQEIKAEPEKVTPNNKAKISESPEDPVKESSDKVAVPSSDNSRQSYESSSSSSSSHPNEQFKSSNRNKNFVQKTATDLVEATTKSPEETQQQQQQHDQDKQQQQQAQSGPWGSASSKSWASLFKGERGAYLGSSVNGDTEHNNVSESENFEETTNSGNRNSNRVENTNHVVASKERRSQDAARRALDKMAPKLAQKINSRNLKHSLPLLRPRGFINKGNWCYINSTLQALIACPPFYNLMKEIGDLRGIGRENSCTPILDSFAELFLNFPPLDTNKKNKQSNYPDQKMQMNYLQAEAIEPKCIYNVLGKIKSECLKGAQEDAEEFLSSVLNGLHEEMIGLSETLQSSQENSSNQNGRQSDVEDTNGDINDDDNLWREVGPKNRSLPIRTATVINTPIQEIFGGSLFSIRTAGKDRCGHRSPFFDLQLDISGDNVRSLEDAIKSFTATEVIQDFYCSKTKQKLDAQRRTSLDQLPPILILHLKQFVYTQDHGLKKVMKKIEYPIDFELPDCCLHDKNSDKTLKNSRIYKLLAVVYHEGKEAFKGHYLTDVFHIGSSQWIRCDDSNLKVVPLPRIEAPDSSRTPYLLFYRRLNTLGPKQNSNHDNKKKS